MKLIQISLLLLLSFSIQAQNSFQQISVGEDAYLFSILEKPDKGFMAFGYTKGFGLQAFDYYLINMDASGNFIWTKTYGGASIDLGYSIINTSDGGYLLGGSTQNFGVGQADVLLIKTDQDGEIQWSKTYGSAQFEDCFDLTASNDGGYVLAGRTNGIGAGDGDIYCIKTNALGDTLWTRTFGGPGNEDAQQIQQTGDGGFIMIGHTHSYGAGNADVYLVKINGNGNLEWTRTYGGPNFDYGNSIALTTDGGYIISGTTNSFGAGAQDILLIKTDGAGNLVWSKTYGGASAEISHFVVQNQDDGFTLTGQTSSFGGGKSDAYSIRTDAAGEIIWAKTYGGQEDEFSNVIIGTTDDHLVLAGNSWSFDVLSSAYIIKTDLQGNTHCNQHSTSTQVGTPALQTSLGAQTNSGAFFTQIFIAANPVNAVDSSICQTSNIKIHQDLWEYELFPNPFDQQALLRFKNKPLDQATLILYDINGRKVRTIQKTWSQQIHINKEDLEPGIYFFQLLRMGETLSTGKMIIKN